MTRRERFLGEMDAVIPWSRLLVLIEPHYHPGKTGRVLHDLERMLRIYFLQQWFNLSDLRAEDELYDSEAMRRFARVELGEDKAPDESTILRFRHLLEKHDLTATHAVASEISQLEELLHGDVRVLYGDQAYWKEADRQAFEAQGVRYPVNRRTRGGSKDLSQRWRKINRARSRTRARGEHPFRIIKQLWGFQKTRYRGIAKNLARAQTMFALANLYAVRHKLRPPGVTCAL